MAKSYISQLNVGSTAYYIKDTEAQADIEILKAAVKDGAHFIGKVNVGSGEGQTPALTDGCHTTPVWIVGKTDAAVAPKAGDFVIQSNSTTTVEFIWDGIASAEGVTPAYTGSWRELGSTGTLKALAFADTASTTYTPGGTVAVENTTVETDTVTNPTFTGTEGDLSVSGTPTGTVSTPTFTGSQGNLSVSGTPEGTVSTPTIAVELATTTFANMTASVSGEVLTLSSSDVTYATGTVSSATSTQPTFTGSALTSTGVFTPEGAVSQPTFTGTALTSTGKFTPAGTNSGTAVTLKAHNHTSTFTGTQATITVNPDTAS